MLQGAAAADAEVRAARHDPLRARPAQRDERRPLPVVLALAHGDLHLLAGQRILDEHHLAFGVVRHALRLEVERLDAKPLVRARHGFDYPSGARLLNFPSPGERSTAGAAEGADATSGSRRTLRYRGLASAAERSAFLAGERP